MLRFENQNVEFKQEYVQSIKKEVMPFVSIGTIDLEEKSVDEVEVSTGTNRPYYLREKGLRAGGVYVRKGSSSQPMTDEEIREMILQTSGERTDYEKRSGGTPGYRNHESIQTSEGAVRRRKNGTERSRKVEQVSSKMIKKRRE